MLKMFGYSITINEGDNVVDADRHTFYTAKGLLVYETVMVNLCTKSDVPILK